MNPSPMGAPRNSRLLLLTSPSQGFGERKDFHTFHWPGHLWGAHHVGPTCQHQFGLPDTCSVLRLPWGQAGGVSVGTPVCVHTRLRAPPRCPHTVCTRVCTCVCAERPGPRVCMLAPAAAHLHTRVHTGCVQYTPVGAHAAQPGRTRAQPLPLQRVSEEGDAGFHFLTSNLIHNSSRKEFRRLSAISN